MSEETLVVRDQTQLPGELLYEYTPKITQAVEYGASADALISGQTPPPVEGARFGIYFEGPITGKLNGTVKGVDYQVWAPGSVDTSKGEIHVRGYAALQRPRPHGHSEPSS